jgi:hypothetical protein
MVVERRKHCGDYADVSHWNSNESVKSLTDSFGFPVSLILISYFPA